MRDWRDRMQSRLSQPSGLWPLLLGAVVCCAHQGPVAAPPAPQAPQASQDRPAPQAPPRSGLPAVVKELVARMAAGDDAAVFAMLGADMKAAVPQDRLRAFLEGLVAERGKPLSAAVISAEADHGLYRLTAERGEWRLEVGIGPDGKIGQLRITPPPEPEPEVARSEGPLALPFRGTWSVLSGGDTRALNAHLGSQSQRRAADLAVAGEGGGTHRGEGRRNEDYYAYGKEVLAVAAGKVVTVIDGVPENEPGWLNEYVATGNLVIVEHGPRLYSVYAHLQRGRTRVKVGALLRAGEVLGRCGNSGRSSEPHLHFQLQDGPAFDRSWGVEAVFQGVDVVREGSTSRQASYTLRKGDLVTTAGR